MAERRHLLMLTCYEYLVGPVGEEKLPRRAVIGAFVVARSACGESGKQNMMVRT